MPRVTSSPRGPAVFASSLPTAPSWAAFLPATEPQTCASAARMDGHCSCVSITASAWCGPQPRESVGSDVGPAAPRARKFAGRKLLHPEKEWNEDADTPLTATG